MITKTNRGSDATKLVAYLFGPGRHNEHTDCHVVAVWDGWIEGHQPPVTDSGFDVSGLTSMLVSDLKYLDLVGSAGTIWHTSVAIPASDGLLSDGQWAQVVEEMVAETGLEDARLGACRWLAVRHGLSREGNDHVHIVAALAGVDATGRTRPRAFLGSKETGGDYGAMRRVANRLEKLWGLTATSEASGATDRGLSRAELEAAAGDEPARRRLERVVRSAAVRVGSADELMAELEQLGVVANFVRPSEQRPGTYLGVAFSSKAYTNSKGEPVRFVGGKLAKDLTAPALQARWDTANQATPVGRGEALGRFVSAVTDATAAVPTVGRAVVHAQASAAAEGLWALADAAEPGGRGPWHDGAAAAARAAREPSGRPPVVPGAAGIAAAGRGMSGLDLPARGTTKRERELARAYLAVARLLRAWAALERASTARVIRAQADRISQGALAATPTSTAPATSPAQQARLTGMAATPTDRTPGVSRGTGA